MACGGMIFTKKILKLEKSLFYIFFSCYYCSIDLKRQSEHSGLLPDTEQSNLCWGTKQTSDVSNIGKTKSVANIRTFFNSLGKEPITIVR